MNASPRLSVIIAAWNASDFIREAIGSALSDPSVDLEVIVVDDKSTDDTARICEEIAAADGRVKVLRMERNGGPGIARNRGFEHARGEYVTFLDADDRVAPGAYSRLLSFADEHDLDISRGNMGKLGGPDELTVPIHPVIPSEEVFSSPDDLRLMALSTMAPPADASERNLNYGAHCGSAIFRREMLIRGGVVFSEVPHAISEDIIYCYQALRASARAGVCTQVVYLYRQNPMSRSHYPAPDLMTRGLDAARTLHGLILADGLPPKDALYALRYGIDIIRSFSKNFLLSGMSLGEKRRWYRAQLADPMIEQCRRDYPMESLSAMHRAAFKSFAGGHFMRLLMLTYARELLRILKK